MVRGWGICGGVLKVELRSNYGNYRRGWKYVFSWFFCRVIREVWIFFMGVLNKILFGSIFFGF